LAKVTGVSTAIVDTNAGTDEALDPTAIGLDEEGSTKGIQVKVRGFGTFKKYQHITEVALMPIIR
jgi:hypothetical protein